MLVPVPSHRSSLRRPASPPALVFDLPLCGGDVLNLLVAARLADSMNWPGFLQGNPKI